ncbi:MAG: DUF1080 domain-containing protein [Acidobacteria bacterium]|nr:DUF1080 domain-containing protein [Acidobacteriota bacterium]
MPTRRQTSEFHYGKLGEMVVRVLVVFLGAVCVGWGANSLSRRERKEGYVLLFDGKSLRDWRSLKQRPDAGPWVVRKRLLTWKQGGSWLATEHKYDDFVLRLEYRTGAQSNSGIFLRSAPAGNPAFSGMELQILSDHGKPPGTHSTGSLYGAVAPARNMAKRDGEWNKVEVSVIQRRVAAIWNGEKILDVNLDDPEYAAAQERPLAERVPSGHIGLQAYSSGTPVQFRNVKIKVLRVGPGFPPKKPE